VGFFYLFPKSLRVNRHPGTSGRYQRIRQALSGNDIGGQVTGDKGPEAGVWVIAETKDLPTKYAKVVVTDYYVWVDRYNTFGLGANVPIASANGSESLLALVNGQFVNLRNPYPLGFFTKNVDGRIDDPNTG
jgi:hypothetical protein